MPTRECGGRTGTPAQLTWVARLGSDHKHWVGVDGIKRHAIQLRVAQHADVQVRVPQPCSSVLQVLQEDPATLISIMTQVDMILGFVDRMDA